MLLSLGPAHHQFLKCTFFIGRGRDSQLLSRPGGRAFHKWGHEPFWQHFSKAPIPSLRQQPNTTEKMHPCSPAAQRPHPPGSEASSRFPLPPTFAVKPPWFTPVMTTHSRSWLRFPSQLPKLFPAPSPSCPLVRPVRMHASVRFGVTISPMDAIFTPAAHSRCADQRRFPRGPSDSSVTACVFPA